MSEGHTSVMLLEGRFHHNLVTWIEKRVEAQSWALLAYRKNKSKAVLLASKRVGPKDLAQWSANRRQTPLPTAHKSCTLTWQDKLTGGATWTLMVGRTRKNFTKQQQLELGVALRQARHMFDACEDERMGRLLVTEEGHVVDADPATLVNLLTEPKQWPQIFELFQQVIGQRWPQLDDDRPHDVVLPVNDEPVWFRFVHQRPQGLPAFWYLETRTLDEDDLPAVGLVDDPRVAETLAYLDDHFADTPTLEELASIVQVSSFHFHRLFSQQVGISPKAYVLRKQIQVAKQLLRATHLPIGEIVGHSGFSSHGHFTATFHRMVGLSPRDYREQH